MLCFGRPTQEQLPAAKSKSLRNRDRRVSRCRRTSDAMRHEAHTNTIYQRQKCTSVRQTYFFTRRSPTTTPCVTKHWPLASLRCVRSNKTQTTHSTHIGIVIVKKCRQQIDAPILLGDFGATTAAAGDGDVTAVVDVPRVYRTSNANSDRVICCSLCSLIAFVTDASVASRNESPFKRIVVVTHVR